MPPLNKAIFQHVSLKKGAMPPPVPQKEALPLQNAL